MFPSFVAYLMSNRRRHSLSRDPLVKSRCCNCFEGKFYDSQKIVLLAHLYHYKIHECRNKVYFQINFAVEQDKSSDIEQQPPFGEMRGFKKNQIDFFLDVYIILIGYNLQCGPYAHFGYLTLISSNKKSSLQCL